MRDSIGVGLSRLIQRALLGETWGSWAIIRTYDAAEHRAKVTLQPSGDETGYLPVMAPHGGAAHRLHPGMQCWVQMVRGEPAAIAGIAYSSVDPLPDVEQIINGDMVIVGQLAVNGPIIAGPVPYLPPASAEMRGAVLVVASSEDGVAGAADVAYVCLQAAGGTLSWKTLATG